MNAAVQEDLETKELSHKEHTNDACSSGRSPSFVSLYPGSEKTEQQFMAAASASCANVEVFLKGNPSEIWMNAY